MSLERTYQSKMHHLKVWINGGLYLVVCSDEQLPSCLEWLKRGVELHRVAASPPVDVKVEEVGHVINWNTGDDRRPYG